MVDNVNNKIAESIHRNIFDATPHASLVFDEKLIIKVLNPMFISEFPEVVLGERIIDYLNDDSKLNMIKTLKDIKLTKFVERLDITLITQAKAYDAEIFLTYLSDSNLYRCIITDKTELNSLRADVAQAKEKSNAIDQAKKKFFAKFSHEIRTPLNSIIGSLSILKDSNLTTDQEELLMQSLDASKVLLATVNDLLDIPQIEDGHMFRTEIRFNIKELVRQIVGLHIKEAMGKAIALNLHIDDRLSEFYVGDMKHLKQVMMNLVGNAVKYTHKGSVDVKLMALIEGSLGSRINLIVEDTGVGLSKDELVEVFKPYVERRIKHENINSSGMGLPICKELIKNLGGELIIDSHKGLGSKFEFVIPMKVPEIESLHQGSLASKNYKAIILEDDPINQKIMTIRLKKMGIGCDVAINGEKGIELCMENDYDIIFMDCQMPIVDGYEATRRIREIPRYKAIPIFALTAHAFSGEREKVLAVGMNEYFTKPIDFIALIQTIYQYLS